MITHPQAASSGDRLFALLQQCLPTRLLSYLVYRVTRIKSVAVKNAMIRAFCRSYGIDLSIAEFEDAAGYAHFNAFFTRALKPGLRPMPADPDAIASPVDGAVSAIGEIDGQTLIQAKGHSYTVTELLGGDARRAAAFTGGSACTIYLAPFDYHRIHMPVDAQLVDWVYVPGRLFSVNNATARALPKLFARNERVICFFETSRGPMALVMVGALFVGSMETVWQGRITPPHKRSGMLHVDQRPPLDFARGDEMGRFNMGSTVILLHAPGALRWDESLVAGTKLRMGQRMGQLSPLPESAS